MYKTYSLPKVVRTWALLLSVPLYVGTSALWLKEEIKDVVSKKEENMMAVMKEQLQKVLSHNNIRKNTLLLP